MGEETCPRQWGFRFSYRLPSPHPDLASPTLGKLSLKYLVEKMRNIIHMLSYLR